MQTLLRILSYIFIHARTIRRVLGIVFLCAAVVMIFIGKRLGDFYSTDGLLIYWGAVFLLLFLTLVLALIDLRALRRDFRIQKKALFVSTFSDKEFRRKIREKHPELFNNETR